MLYVWSVTSTGGIAGGQGTVWVGFGNKAMSSSCMSLDKSSGLGEVGGVGGMGA